MAAQFFKFNRNTSGVMEQMVRALRMIRDGMLLLEQTRASIIQIRDGSGASATDYDQWATEGGFSQGDYPTVNDAAKAEFDEIDSLYAKVGTDGATSAVRTAITQACAKHGI